MTNINIHSNVLIFNDSTDVTNNPKRRYVDWTRHLMGIDVTNPLSQSLSLPPGQTVSVFSGVRTLAAGVGNVYAITLENGSSTVYRLGWSGPQDPGFVTARAITGVSGRTATLTINNNITVGVALSGGGTPFSAVVVGDKLFIPGLSTGDIAGPFNVSNEGEWIVLGVTALTLTLQRPSTVTFQAAAEAVLLTTDTNFVVYAENNVQVGDTLDLLGGFSSVSRRPLTITSVKPTYISFMSTEPLPLESNITLAATDWYIYSAAKRFIHIEVDQDSKALINGDTSESGRMVPVVAGDANQTAILQKWGTVWALSIVNRSQTAWLNATVITAE
jgi:hypothetical protein